MSYKIIALIIIAVALLVLWGLRLIFKRISLKNTLLFSGVAVLLCVCLIFTNITSVDDYYLAHIDYIQSDSKTVSLYIGCKTALGKTDNKYIPKTGVILPKTDFVLRDNDTVFSVFSRVMKYKKIRFEYSGTSAYIEGINYLYEFDCGSLSGWMYFVNGKSTDKGCADYLLKDGDEIRFVYTCNIGKDLLKGGLEP